VVPEEQAAARVPEVKAVRATTLPTDHKDLVVEMAAGVSKVLRASLLLRALPAEQVQPVKAVLSQTTEH
jgi:hypothetical protein